MILSTTGARLKAILKMPFIAYFAFINADIREEDSAVEFAAGFDLYYSSRGLNCTKEVISLS